MERIEWLRPKDQFEIPLGAHVRDRISGFDGIASSRVEYLTGCTQYGIIAESKGVLNGAEYLDWQRLEYSTKKTGLEGLSSSTATQRGDGCMGAPSGNKLSPR